MDGGFQMTLQELVTATEEKLPVKYALINNGHLGMVRQWQEMYFDNHLKAVPVPGPDFVKLAEAYGVGAVRVSEQEGRACPPCERPRPMMARSSSNSWLTKPPTSTPWCRPAARWPTRWEDPASSARIKA